MERDLREVGFEEIGWIQLAQNDAWRWALILCVFELSVCATRVLKIAVFCGMAPCKNPL
jgi:hypothetical protein